MNAGAEPAWRRGLTSGPSQISARQKSQGSRRVLWLGIVTRIRGDGLTMRHSGSRIFVFALTGAMLAAAASAQMVGLPKIGAASPSPEPGLLFYLSGDHGFDADYAASGQTAPNFQSDVQILPGGAKGSYIQCGNNQLLSYWAPGNIYAQRGTLSFYWRSRDPVDETAFPVFRVGYADHSSGTRCGCALTTTATASTRSSPTSILAAPACPLTCPNFPKPDQWTHLALTWDETTGIRFYVNGKLVWDEGGDRNVRCRAGPVWAAFAHHRTHRRGEFLQLRPRRRYRRNSHLRPRPFR